MKFFFKLQIDSDKAREFWKDWIVLESCFEQSEKRPPRAEDVVQDAIKYVFELDDKAKEDKLLKEVFTEAVNNGRAFNVKFDLKKSSSK